MELALHRNVAGWQALDIQNSGHIDCDLFIRRGWCHLQLANTREAFKDVTEAQVDVEHAPAAAGRVNRCYRMPYHLQGIVHKF